MGSIEETTNCRSDDIELYDKKVAEKFYDDRYQNRYMESWPLEKYIRIADIIKELSLPRTGHALDFGCGTGVFTSVLKSVLPDWEVNGTDISTKALEIARVRQPDCVFHELADCEHMTAQFDFIFSHHVLEHVSDLTKTSEMLASLIKPSGSMLHILPCADPGSLEYQVCIMRLDGIVGESEQRFFYDEEGHLRRLTTHQVVSLWKGVGFQLNRAYYANKFFGGLRFLTNNGIRFILDFANPSVSCNLMARICLLFLRYFLLSLWLLRKPIDVVKLKRKYGFKGFRDYCVMLLSVLAYPVSIVVESILQMLEEREWMNYRQKPGGSEMYLFIKSD